MSRSSTLKYRLAFGPDGTPRVRFVPATWQHRGRLREMSYVEFYVWDDVQQCVVRKRISNFNGLTTTEEKQTLAEKEIIPQLSELLLKGYIITPKPAKKKPLTPQDIVMSKQSSLLDLAQAAFQSAKTSNALSENTLKGYTTVIRVLTMMSQTLPWVTDTPALELQPASLKILFNSIRTTRTPNATNNFIRGIKALLNRAKEMGAELPFPIQAKLQRVKKQRNTVLRAVDREKLTQAIQALHPELALVIGLMQYAFIRPGKELQSLRIRDIYLDSNEIVLAAAHTKNGNRDTAVIPPPLRAILEPLKLQTLPGDWYLVGHKGKPGPRTYHINHWSQLHRECVRYSGLDSSQYNLYSWRSTGAYRAISEFGYPILWLMGQMRHSSLDITSKYLTSIGVKHLHDMRPTTPQAQPHAAENSQASSFPQSKPDIVSRLQQLAALLQQGLLSRDEFDQLKQQLMSA